VIPDEAEDDGKLNFYWFYFIGSAKLHLTLKEIGRMTLTTFNRLYEEYKKDFDLELMLDKSRTTYRTAEEKARRAEEWF
jgi:hypothetical protein